MDRQLIYETVRNQTLRIVEECTLELFDESKSVIELGGDSLDAVEIAAASAKQLKIKLPRIKLMEVHNLKGLIDLLHESANTSTTGHSKESPKDINL